MKLYKGNVLNRSDSQSAGWITVQHHLFGPDGQSMAPLMNTPGSLRLPDIDSEVVFAKVEGDAGSTMWVYFGEIFKSNSLRMTDPDEENHSVGTVPTGMKSDVNTGRLTDYDLNGIHTIYRVNSPNDLHSIELMEQVNPSVDGSGACQEKLGIKIKTQDGKGIFLDDGQLKGKDGIKFYLEEGSEESNCLVMSKGGVEGEISPNSFTLVMDNNVEITSNLGNITINIPSTGTGELRIENHGTGGIGIENSGPGSIDIDSEGDISVSSTQGDINIEAGDGEDYDIDCDYSQFSCTQGTHTGNIYAPVKKHPKIMLNGKPAITLRQND